MLEGFGEVPEGEKESGGAYSYVYETLETGEMLIDGIPFDPGRLNRQPR